MNIYKLNLSEIPQFSRRDLAYINEIDALRPFYKYPVSLEAFKEVIEDKSKEKFNRDLIVEALELQYQTVSTTNEVRNKIELLKNENTYTVVTAHQPSLLTGPSYYFYKIFSAINLTRQLSESYPNYNFVPIFITGGEDHDFAEINHFSLFGKSFVWETEQSGPVGRYQLDAGFDKVLEELFAILGSSDIAMKIKLEINRIRSNSTNYGRFAFQLTDYFFKELGLVVLDMSSDIIKKSFQSYISEEVMQTPSKGLVEATQNRLESIQLKPQATAREINFFYIGDGDRNRLIKENGHFKVLNTDLTFSYDELKSLIEQRPQDFSPNVVMRPIYQESFLPNLAYIGGGGEIAYWLERRSQFDHFGINFPMLIRRNSGMIVDKGSSKKISKLDLIFKDLLPPEDYVINKFLSSKNEENLDFTEELSNIENIFERIASKASKLDSTLEPKILAEGKKIMKQTEQLAGRVKRAAKQNEEVSVNQIRSLKAKLFPNNGLQERNESFIGIYMKYGPRILKELTPHFDPLQKTMVIVEE